MRYLAAALAAASLGLAAPAAAQPDLGGLISRCCGGGCCCIGGARQDSGDCNPANPCEVCDPSNLGGDSTPNEWTNVCTGGQTAAPQCVDAGPGELDAGQDAGPDAGPSDAGPDSGIPVDAGPEVDAGPVASDTGPTDTDAGPPPVDVDAGGEAIDAGPQGTDAGTSGAFDAGMGETSADCSCRAGATRSSSGGVLMLLAGLALAFRRRRG